MGFFRRNNYFVHVLIRLQVQEAYACIIKLRLINTFLHAISKSCMNVVTVVCQVRTSMHAYTCACMHACTHLAFKELISEMAYHTVLFLNVIHTS